MEQKKSKANVLSLQDIKKVAAGYKKVNAEGEEVTITITTKWITFE